MRWRINDYIFCERQQTLISFKGNQEISHRLEPMVVELLTYFCRNNNQIVSRDQLIDSVWMGRMITDNAVNKVITKLRKAFNDDPKQPKFIATFPKKGYKFIADVESIDEKSTNKNSDNKEITHKDSASNQLIVQKKKNHVWLYLLMILLPVIVIIGLIVSWQIIRVPQAITQVEALTRDPGRESRGHISPDGKYLAYVEVHNKKMHQWIKSLEDEVKIEVNHGNEKSVWVDSVSWNNSGNKIVYLVTTSQSCQYFMRSFKDLTLGEPELIHNCPAGSYGKIVFTHDDNILIYSENEGENSPFSLFEMNLKTGKKRRLNQPELHLGGNSQFDLHPTKNKLLISSPDKQQWEGFYELNLDTDILTLLFKQDAFICCGIWDHTGKRVVLMGEHPANELVSFNLKGHDRRIVYSGSEQLRVPERHVNGKDYLFSVVHVNQDIKYLNFKSNINSIIANTTVDERLARFAYHNNTVAYIGLSTGNEEIWITDTEGKVTKKLTQFNDSRHFIDLQWSYNGEYLLGLTLNEIYLINSVTGEDEILKIPQVEIRGVSWKSDNVVSYSINYNNEWQVNHYDINTHSVSPSEKIWDYIRYTINPDDTLKLDKNGNLLVGKENKKIAMNEIKGINFLNGRAFNIMKKGEIWAWQKREDSKNKLFIKKDYKIKEIAESDGYYFDLSQKGLLYHSLSYANSDIYRTVASQ